MSEDKDKISMVSFCCWVKDMMDVGVQDVMLQFLDGNRKKRKRDGKDILTLTNECIKVTEM